MSSSNSVASLIENIVKDIPGWSPPDQLLALYLLSLSNSNISGDILEIGSWCGRSSVVLGLAAKLMPGTKVHCVDLFPEKSDWYENEDGTFSIKVSVDEKIIYGCREQTLWRAPFQEDILPIYEKYQGGPLQVFLDTMKKNGVEDIVTPQKGNLEIFKGRYSNDLKIKMAFIDGDHAYEEVVKDIKGLEPFLTRGAWICFDDAFTVYDGVDKAINEYILNNDSYTMGYQVTRKLFVAKYVGHNTAD